ncbi:hypothetical protein L6260_01035, partial [Candidatus Parcubacteria bacterium]|nr:hypothetical protein [Candidatus Parcubacteria bacterium]
MSKYSKAHATRGVQQANVFDINVLDEYPKRAYYLISLPKKHTIYKTKTERSYPFCFHSSNNYPTINQFMPSDQITL